MTPPLYPLAHAYSTDMVSMGRKTRPQWQALSYWKSGKQWRKQYQGKTYYLGQSGVQKNRQSHDLALTEWVRLKQEIDQQHRETPQAQRYLSAAQEHERLAQVARLTGFPSAAAERLTQAAQDLERQSLDPKAPSPSRWDTDPLRGISESGRAVWRFAAQQAQALTQAQRGQHDKPKTVQDGIDQFLRFKHNQAQQQERSIRTYDRLKTDLKKFAAWHGESKPIDTLNDDALENYYGQIISQDLSPHSKKSRFDTLKQLLRYLKNRKLIEPLYRLDDKQLSIRVPRPKPKTVPLEAIRLRLDNACPRTRLYLLLMLNCGFTQIDISDLTADEIDFKQGRIIRQRSKTRHEDPPTVNYLLWDETAKLLKKEAKRTGQALLNKNGNPLVISKVGKTGNVFRADGINEAYKYLQTKIDGPRYPLKLYRKTSASMLSSNHEHERYVEHFLGHRPQSIANLHYVEVNQSRFDEAVTWLGKQVLAR